MPNLFTAIHAARSLVKGYRLFMIIIAFLIGVSFLLSLKDSGEIANYRSGGVVIEHLSRDWYRRHLYSDGKKIPINKTITGILIEKVYSLDLEKTPLGQKDTFGRSGMANWLDGMEKHG